ncbi:MAG: hypothetical protein FWH36_07195 [Lentimicrobiaceae bacterium]|nr:hypothetical protein [Lentimicrobiaceae bacterium]
MKKILLAVLGVSLGALFLMGCTKEFDAPEKTDADKLKEEFDKAYWEWVKQGSPITKAQKKALNSFGDDNAGGTTY